MTTPHLTPRRERWLLLTLAGIQFTHILDFMIMMPLGPQFTALFGISNAQFGLLVSAYTLSAGFSGLMAATYIDRFGRKQLLLSMYSLFGLATLACAFAPDYVWLMVARVAAGLFGGVLSALSQTIVADVIPFERRGRAMSVVMTSFSVSTVAGVPLGLFLAAHFNWHAPFVGIAALVGLLALGAWQTLPRLDAHLYHPERVSVWRGIGQVLAEPNHLKAFAVSGLMMFAAFSVIPYITIYLQSNAGMQAAEVPWIYLCGGLATLLSARYFGRLTDRVGKVRMFQRLALAVTVPLMATTLSQGLPLWGLLAISTLFFTVMSGRMIPGMAMISSAVEPRLRGTFMTLNSAVQSASMGLAALVAGLIIGRDAQGQLTLYWVAGLLGVVASLLSVWLAGHLRLHGAPAQAAG
ncbi:MFS transporter [Limnohabitans sp. 2KL-51]|jgi:predicted MFS family arabinose efflux permease|uniref:MFS transporter n=1 Tax=Limnohabitans sp. 2KL-51 TaxID=1977911 RepID=UPI000D35B464|nr:MFS transporter [Limnohabitans sp. 2KL-51]PUE52452.1 MFS transporter [Limnohabitans sp. 2KL-51]